MLFSVLREHGLAPESYCGGAGSCGKCTVLVNGTEVLSCRTRIDRDMSVELPERFRSAAAQADPSPEGRSTEARCPAGRLLAYDVGTTTLCAYRLDAHGRVLGTASRLNPQMPYGADVVSRLRSALTEGTARAQQDAMREAMRALAEELGLSAEEASSDAVRPERIAFVGNPAMQQLLLGLDCTNLVKIPFLPVITGFLETDAGRLFPEWAGVPLLSLPDFSGYVGADTAACLFAEGFTEAGSGRLLVDIGTNGELVLGGPCGLVCTATAAGPALEGAGISCGMRAAAGAIDHVSLDENGRLRPHVIGEEAPEAAKGICGSGLIDAVACARRAGLISERGKIIGGDTLPLTDNIELTQEDIRALMLAKGAIAAGIRLLAEEAGLALEEIREVVLAGAFGSFMDAENACRIGLIPAELSGRIRAVGNAAGRGACLLAAGQIGRDKVTALTQSVRPVELASLPGFRRTFARCMLL